MIPTPVLPALLLLGAPQQAAPPPPVPELADPLAVPAASATSAPAISAPQADRPSRAASDLADPLDDPAASPAPSTRPTLADDFAPPDGIVVGGFPKVDRPAVPAPGDPLERTNRRFFAAHETFDRRFFRPAALGYKHAVPRPVRSALRNFFSNLGEPIVFLNYLLQLKPGKAGETLGRFAINSTLGIGGLVDVAKEPTLRLPHRSNGFGNTLALYGVKPGPYLFLPFVGPTTLRDLLGGQADGFVLPLAVGKPFDRAAYQIPKGVVTGLDRRAESDAELNALFAGAVDPYATLRSAWLQNRQGEIDQLRGHRRAAPPAPDLGEPLSDPAGTGPKPGDSPDLADPLSDPAAPR